MEELLHNHYYTVLSAFLVFIFATNIPVGMLRKRYPKFSRPWARCIYIPILVNVILRRLIGLTFKSIPFILLALIAGQILGSRLRAGQKSA